MECKTILWIYNHPLKPEAGGTERITSLVMRGLSANGHKCLGILVVDLTKGNVSYDDIEVPDIYSFLKEKYVDTVINQCGHGKEMLEFFLEKGGRKWHEEGGKIITCLHYDPKPYSVRYQFLSKKNKNWHDYYVIAKTWFLNPYLELQEQKCVGGIYKYNYENSDFFLLLSDSFKDYVIRSMGVRTAPKLIAINNPLTFKNIADVSILEKKRNIILIVSRMYEYQKRISLALKVWELLFLKNSMSDWELKIVGTGENLNEYMEYVKIHHIDRVTFAGQQSPHDYYNEAKIFLMTSQMEGWGLTLTESLQCGVVPVVFDKCSAFHDIIIDGENGFFVKDGRLRTFAKRIEYLALHHTQWENMAKNALKSAEKYQLDNIIKKWEKII